MQRDGDRMSWPVAPRFRGPPFIKLRGEIRAKVLLETTPVSTEIDTEPTVNAISSTPASLMVVGRAASSDRAEELMEKFRLLLGSPLAEGVARIVEESFRLLPIIPPVTSGEPSRYAQPIDLKQARHDRG